MKELIAGIKMEVWNVSKEVYDEFMELYEAVGNFYLEPTIVSVIETKKDNYGMPIAPNLKKLLANSSKDREKFGKAWYQKIEVVVK